MTAMEELLYDGEADNDSLTVVGTGGDDVITHTAGAGNDEGTFRVNTTLALAYQNLGAAATLDVDADADAGSDEFVYVGTILGDRFTVNAAGNVALNARLSVAIVNANTLTLEAAAATTRSRCCRRSPPARTTL